MDFLKFCLYIKAQEKYFVLFFTLDISLPLSPKQQKEIFRHDQEFKVNCTYDNR